MKYVLDASVALCWVIPRPLTLKAVRLRDGYRRKTHELLAPEVFIDEVAGALTKAERQKDIAVGQAAPLFVQVMNSPPILIRHAPLIARAIDISSRTRSAYYDCLIRPATHHPPPPIRPQSSFDPPPISRHDLENEGEGNRGAGRETGARLVYLWEGNTDAISLSMNLTAGWNPRNQLVASVADWLAFRGRPSGRRGKGVRNEWHSDFH